jgi:glycosyltransferase involved in cell wall biosynthesis
MSKQNLLVPLLGITRHGGSIVIYDLIEKLSQYFNITILTGNTDDQLIQFPFSVRVINLNTSKRNLYSIFKLFIKIIILRFKFKYILATHFIIFFPLLISLKFKVILIIQGEEFMVIKNNVIRYILSIFFKIFIKIANTYTTSAQISIKYKLKFINIGINEKFHTQINNNPIKKYDIIYFGRIEKYKRFDLFNQIYANTKYNILIVTNDLNVINLYRQKNFTYVYIENDRQLVQCIDSARITVLTSDYEGLGLTPIECMSRGVVPIIRDCFGPNAYAINGVNSVVIKKNDPPTFYIDATDFLIEYNNLQRMKINCQNTAKKFNRKNAIIALSDEIKNYYIF